MDALIDDALKTLMRSST